jgi:hypothetical protein
MLQRIPYFWRASNKNWRSYELESVVNLRLTLKKSSPTSKPSRPQKDIEEEIARGEAYRRRIVQATARAMSNAMMEKDMEAFTNSLVLEITTPRPWIEIETTMSVCSYNRSNWPVTRVARYWGVRLVTFSMSAQSKDILFGEEGKQIELKEGNVRFETPLSTPCSIPPIHRPKSPSNSHTRARLYLCRIGILKIIIGSLFESVDSAYGVKKRSRVGYQCKAEISWGH